MALSNPYTGKRMPGYVGQPLQGMIVKLVREDGSEIPESSSESGELLVSGEEGSLSPRPLFCTLTKYRPRAGLSMFSRYINLPEKTAAEFSGGFFKTGDIAARERVGDEGVYFKILGRASMVVLQRTRENDQQAVDAVAFVLQSALE